MSWFLIAFVMALLIAGLLIGTTLVVVEIGFVGLGVTIAFGAIMYYIGRKRLFF